MSNLNIIISGAGIAGPVLAFFLARAGSHVTIVEKAATLLSQGQNIDLQGSALTVARKMGVLDEILRANTGEKGTQFVTSDGKPFAAFPLKDGFTMSPTSRYEILRGDLAAVLYAASKGLDNVKYLFGRTVKNVLSNDEDAVKVELDDGTIHNYDLLVAADGQWSRLRKTCFPAESLTVVDKGQYASYWTIPRLPSDNDFWNVYVTKEAKLLSTRPDPYGTIRAMATCMPQNAAQKAEWQKVSRGGDKKLQQELLKREFANAGWQAERFLAGLDDAPDFYFQAVQQIKLSEWSVGRVICLGDAAYAPTPLTGMGTSLAINGAYVLAGELSKLEKGEHPKRALESYELMYKPFVEKVQELPSFVPGVMHPVTGWHRWMLQTFFSGVSVVIAGITSIPWLKGRMDVIEKEDFPLPRYGAFEGEKRAW